MAGSALSISSLARFGKQYGLQVDATTVFLAVLTVLITTLLLIIISYYPGKAMFRNSNEGFTVFRYLATFEDDPFAKGPDDLAQHFIPAKARKALNFAPMRAFLKYQWERRLPGLYGFIVAKTRLWDIAVQQVIKKNHVHGKPGPTVSQLVILNAGFDTRANRYEDLLRSYDVRAFEVSTKEIVAKKESILRAQGEKSAFVSRIIGDVSHLTDLQRKLKEAGFDKKATTMFLLENTTQYMSEKDVCALFKFIRENSGQSSVVCFDYLRTAATQVATKAFGAAQFVTHLSDLGESHGGFTFDGAKEVNVWLQQQNFSLLQHITVDALQDFARKTTSRMVAKVARHTEFVVAQVSQ